MRTPRLLAGLLAGAFLPLPAVAQQYVGIEEAGTVYGYDNQTGCMSGVLGTVPGVQEINAMARDPRNGRIYVSGGWFLVQAPELYELDPGNWSAPPVATPLDTGGAPLSVRGMAIDPNGTLWVTSWVLGGTGTELWSFDIPSGVGTRIATAILPSSVQALEWDETNQRLLGWDNGFTGYGLGLVHIDPQTGVVTDAGPVGSSDIWEVQGMSFDRNGRLVTVGYWWMYEVDPVTGQILRQGSCFNTQYARGVEDVRPAGMQLALGGSCPGPMTVELTSGTPGAQAAIAWAFGNTGFTIPAGPCAGTAVQLSAPATLLGVYVLDAQGAFTLGPLNVPANACGNVWLQAIDLSNCEQTAARQP